MKKQLMALAVLTAGFANAQTWSENFSSVTVPGLPTNWLQNNVDGNTVSSNLSPLNFGTNAWVTYDWSPQSIPAAASHGKAVTSTSRYTSAGTSNDWLITPSFTVPANGFISWDALATDANNSDGYLVKISTTGTLTTNFSTTLLTVPAENSAAWSSRNLNLNSYAGQTVRIAFVNNSTNKYLLLLDNISVIVPPANDLKMTTIAPTGSAVWGMVGTTKAITGTVINNGLAAVTSFTAKYSDGTTTMSTPFTGLNLAYGQSYNFSISPSFSITAAQETKLKVWASVTGDGDHTNDTLKTSVNGYSFLPNHKVVFEEGTGTWCGFCVRGAVYMDSMHAVNPNTTVLIAVHNGDPMTVTAYNAGIGTLINGYPTALCGRATEVGDPGDMFDMYNSHLADFAVGDLTLTPTYNATTRLASIAVDAKIASSFSNNNSTNDYRIAVVFTEDGVTGTTTGYDQHNYYTGNAYGPLSGAGHNWATEPGTVVAANMKYDYVARALVGGFSGLANSLPSSVVAGATTSNTFTYTVPAAYNTNKMKAHALLIDAKNNIVYNANSTSYLSTATNTAVGISEKSSENSAFGLYPNPATSNVTIDLNLGSSETVSVNIYNALGILVYSDVKSNLSAGQNEIALNTESFASGIYNVTISTAHSKSSRKLIISK